MKNRTVLSILLAGWIMVMGYTGLEAVVGEADRSLTPPGDHPTAMAFDGELIWVADSMSFKLYGLDPVDGTPRKTLNAPGYDPRGLAWDGEYLWYVDGREGWIYGLETESGVARRLLESNSADPGGLAFDGEFLWLLDRKAGRILRINRRDGMMHENIPAPAALCNGLAWSQGYLWVTASDEDMLYRVDPASGDVVTWIPAPGPYAWGICFSGGDLWVTDHQEARVRRVKLTDDVFVRRSRARDVDWVVAVDFRNFGPGTVEALDACVAIPRERDNQVLLTQTAFSPTPAEMVTDQWKQPFARFRAEAVAAGERQLAELRVRARLFHTEYIVFPERVGSLAEIPADLKPYLADGFKYDITHPVIRKATAEAVGKEIRPYWIMRRIFNYILDKIDYKLKPLGGWNPAPTVLQRGTGSCSEYSFVFIAMCRAAGLPARFVGSVVVRSEDRGRDEVWHRWPEVFLPRYGWVPVDPSAEGKRDTPGGIARLIGTVGNRYLITTEGGGDSEFLDTYYNFKVTWQTRGKCRVESHTWGEYTPVSEVPAR
ncbi:MAG: transglutaminase [Candidatus Aminicenantes bacterium]|nr:transglutaminase [Candidatus Aminicenantes bacterium]